MGLTRAAAGAVLLKLDESVLWALIDRPETRNAINLAVITGLEEMVAVAREQRVKVVVIRGTGGTFSSGADLHELRRMLDDPPALASFMVRFGTVLEELERAPWVNVAVVEGHAVAGGCELLLASDIVIAASDAHIGDGHVEYGLAPAGGASVRLPRAIASAFARYLLLTGEMLSGEEAARKGLAAIAVPPGALDTEVRRIVQRLSSRGSATLKTVKAMLASGGQGEIRPLLRRELDLFLDHIASAPDPRRGLRAFHQGEEPSFDGRPQDIRPPPRATERGS
jgi:enoyl-CoA hydratase/carnithine racemase